MTTPYDIMLSYRIIDTGAVELGGDGTVVRVKAWLEAEGFRVFVGEDNLEGGQDWVDEIQAAIEGCQGFVVLCSPG